MRLVLNASVALAALALAMPAMAQQSVSPAGGTSANAPTSSAAGTTADTNTPQTGETTGIQDIIVTAQRRSESSQRAAIPITVVGPAQLNNAGVVTATTLNAAVPSLYVARAGGANTSFFIRGVGNFTNNGYSDPAVAFNVDGVYYGRPTSTTGTFYDLDRVEVLKGPQGTLYGRNATGGAINIIPARPQIGKFGGYLSGGYGRFQATDGEGAINLPIGPSTAVRLSGKAVDSKGFLYDGTSDEVGQAVRAQVLTRPSDALTIRLAADYSHTGGAGTGSSFNGVEAYTPGSPQTATSPVNYTYFPANLGWRTGLFTPEALAYYSKVFVGGPRINPGPVNFPFQNNKYWGTNAEITLRTGVGTLTFIPAYRDSKVNNLFNGPAFRGGLIDEHDKQTTAELRFNSERVGPFEYLLGGFYYHEKIHGIYTFSQYTIQSYQNFNTGTDSAAAFGRITTHLGDKVRLVAGARYTHDQKFFNGTAQTLVEACTRATCAGGPSVPLATSLANLATVIPAALIPAGLPPAPGPANARPFGAFGNILFYAPVTINAKLPKKRLTYRLAAEYDVGPASLLYASFETGYRSGGFSLAAGHDTYQPEYIKAWTIGLKNRFFDNRVQLNIEAFRWQYSNQQVSHFGFDVNGNSAFLADNIGKSRIQGLDVDAQVKVAPTTLLRGSVQYLDNKLTSFVYIAPRGGTSLPPVVGCPFSNGADPNGRTVYFVDCSGRQGFNSPRWSANAGFDQTFDVGSYKLVVTADGRYRSNRVTGFDYLPQQNSGAQTIFDASLNFGPRDDRWTLTAWGRNLTNRIVPVYTQFAATTGNIVSTTYAAPRTYGVRARFNF